jgi:hypothetical protein
MKLADLSKPQWDAAQHAARCLMQGSPNRETDRAIFRSAVTELCVVLPGGVDAKTIIQEAARWQMLNDIAAAISGLPVERLPA